MFFLRCILSPVSSAVILPALLDFKQKGLGEDKGIITLVMAACSFDDIFAISAFGVCLSIIFSDGSYFRYLIILSVLSIDIFIPSCQCMYSAVLIRWWKGQVK